MNSEQKNKPIPLRIIFILNALKVLLAFGFYYAFTKGGIESPGPDPQKILYTALAYVGTFVLMVTSILKRKITFFRILLGIDLIISLPVKAFIGIGVVIISFMLTFNKKVKSYFSYRE